MKNCKKFVLMVILGLSVFSSVVMGGSLEIVNNTKGFWISLTAVQTSNRNRMLDEFVERSGGGIAPKSLGPGESTKATWPKEEHPIGGTTLYVDMMPNRHGFYAYKVDFSSQDKKYFEVDDKKYEYYVTSRGNDYTLTVQPVGDKN